jgi:protein-disulfide isomerase
MASGKTNWFAIWVSVAVVVVLVAVGGAVWWANASADSEGTVPESSAIDPETGAIAVGEGSNELDLYFDFYCPHCQQFEQVYGETVDELVSSGDLTLNLHPVALTTLNTASGTDFSKRSANALYCVAVDEPEAALPFMQSVFAQNPTGPGLTDEQLIAAASDAGATGAADCITDRTYVRYVDSRTTEIPENPETGSAGTPTVILNGEWVELTGDPQADLVAALR